VFVVLLLMCCVGIGVGNENVGRVVIVIGYYVNVVGVETVGVDDVGGSCIDMIGVGVGITGGW